MKEEKTKLLTVSEVAKALGVNVTTIRYYNRTGLIWSERDGENNYRYYNEEQLPNFKIILNLRQLGFSVEKIKEIKENIGIKNYDAIIKMMQEQEEEYKKEIDEIKEKIRLLEDKRKHIEYLNDINKVDPNYITFDKETHGIKRRAEGVFYIKNIDGIDYAVFYAGKKMSERDAINKLFEKVEELGYHSVGDLRMETINPEINSEEEHRKIKIFKIPIKSLT